MSITDNIVLFFLRKMEKIPIEIKLFDYKYKVIISSKKEEK